MELTSPLISWINLFPSRVINRTIFFCNALESHECPCCLLSFLYFHWLFPLLERETSSGNRSIYKSSREKVDSKGLCGRWRLHLMSSWVNQISCLPACSGRVSAFALSPAWTANRKKNDCLLRQIRYWRGNSIEKYERFYYRSYLFVLSKCTFFACHDIFAAWGFDCLKWPLQYKCVGQLNPLNWPYFLFS